ncbi:MAG: molybdopterin cofactor-binding domain-containing protein [Bacteroidota bacterium]
MGKWTRRAFITGGVLAGGALILGVAIRRGDKSGVVKGMIASDDETVFDIWLKISPDNSVTAIVPHAEMGQGVHTSLAMMLADEMDADWDKIKVMEAPAHKEYANYALGKGFMLEGTRIPSFLVGTVDGAFLKIMQSMNMQITGGSTSVRTTGMHGMRVAGAAAKATLLKAAAKEWGVNESSLRAEKSMIYDDASNRSATYAELAPKAAGISMPANPELKKPEEFKIMGTSPQRLDIPAKVNGTASFGMDVSLPNMKYATVKASPVFGNKVKSMEASAAESMKGVHKVYNLDDKAVAVVADGYWTAKQALNKVKIDFGTTDNNAVLQEDIYTNFAKAMDDAVANGDQEEDFESGDPEGALASASKVIEAEYKIPYLAHAAMEPMNCTAWIHDGIAEIWTGTQNPLGVAAFAAEFLDMDEENVKVHNQYLGGAFGRRAQNDAVEQALTIAKDLDSPVKLIWSREEDMQQDFYREAAISRFKGGIDENGKASVWINQYVYKKEPAEASHIPYSIENTYAHYTDYETHVPWGPWRSVAHSKHAFFTESFIDEMSIAQEQDPYEYRRELLSDNPRFLKVLETVAEKADWNKELPENWGRGIAIHKSFGTIVAEVAEVEVKEDGKVRVHKVVCAADPGFAVHEDGFKAQIESGVIYGLTAAMYGEIKIDQGKVAQSNFHDYQMIRMNEAPEIEVHIINSGEFPGGAGEPGTPAIAPAVTNAIFDATGTRIRELPINLQKISLEDRQLSSNA